MAVQPLCPFCSNPVHGAKAHDHCIQAAALAPTVREVTRLNVKPGEVLLVRLHNKTTVAQMERAVRMGTGVV